MTTKNDVVLIYFEEKPAVFARIESIEPDIKKDWYHVTLLLLAIPMQTVTWILRDVYINGTPFTMGGKPVRIEAVPKTELKKDLDQPPTPQREKTGAEPGKVIPLKKQK